MSLFDSIKGAVFEAAEGEAKSLIAGMLEKSGGLDGVLGKLQASGLGGQVASWLAEGHNLPISTDQLQAALGDEHLQEMASHLGLPVDKILAGLSEHLPSIAAAMTNPGA
jgi:uncharacterized protein YidB (DUF937 family)